MRHLTALFGILLMSALAIGQTEKRPFQVPEPKGWAKESINLPPDFASDMKWKGTEDIRFAPGMFKADATDFFSYALLFWLPDDQKIDSVTMERELLTYYRGLAKAVLASGKRDGVDFAKFSLTIKDAKVKTGKRPTGEEYVASIGELKWVEPFATAKPQTLRFEIQTWYVEKHKHHCVFMCVSPQPETNEVWKSLREIRDGVMFP